MAKRPSKELVERLKGKSTEPDIEKITSAITLTKALNQYHLISSRDEATTWLCRWCNNNGMKDYATAIKERRYKTASSLTTMGFCCRLLDRGLNLELLTPEMLKKSISNIEILEARPEVKKQVQMKINELFVEYNLAYDEAALGKKPTLEMKGTNAEIAEVKRQMQADLDDVRLFPSEYSHPKQLIAFIESCLQAQTKQATRRKTTRPKKAVRPCDAVKRLRYLKEHEGRKSFNPEKIVGAFEMFVFDVKTRKLSYFQCKTPKGLNVERLSVIDYDEDKSWTVTVRKPEEFLALATTHARATKNAELLKTRKFPVKHRLTAETLLLTYK